MYITEEIQEAQVTYNPFWRTFFILFITKTNYFKFTLSYDEIQFKYIVDDTSLDTLVNEVMRYVYEQKIVVANNPEKLHFNYTGEILHYKYDGRSRKYEYTGKTRYRENLGRGIIKD